MKNTEYSLNVLDSIISSEDSLSALFEMIDDLGLEITDLKKSW